MKTYLAINKNDDIRMKSSSGGVFHSLASYVLNNNGIVFGAAWNSDWLVDMKAVDNLNDLNQLLGSKYLLANVKNTFDECKKFLDSGKQVLYSGIGCQLHALKKYLNKDYDNLVLCEICCHGTMLNNIWLDYLDTIKRDSPIVDISMRDKTTSWDNYNITITYADGCKITSSHSKNKYMNLYLSDKYLRSSCYKCTFKNNYSIADCIIGDLWAIKDKNSEYNRYNDHKGCSFIQIRTNKLENILDKLNLKLISIPQETIYKWNGGTKNIIDRNKIEKYTPTLFNNKCAIISLPLHENIGGYLQSYALKTIVNNLGYNCDVINYIPTWYKKPLLPFIEEIKPIQIKDANSYHTILNNNYDNIIVGSDQIWRPRYVNKDIRNSFLDFCYNDDTINKISYGASFGSDIWEYTQEQELLAKKLIKKFSAISVRELDAVNICKEHLDVNANQVLDPTMLLTRDHYLNLCKDIPKKNNYVFTYFLDNSIDYNMKIIKHERIISNKSGNIYDWLACFRDCKYVITDSYHGCIFAIIFDKPFICIENKDRGLSRFDTLKKLFDLNNNFIYNIDNIDYNINNIKKADQGALQELRYKSHFWLEKNLKK